MCDCGCNNCGDSFSGLNGLLGGVPSDYVYAGSVVEWRGNVFAGGATSGTPTYLDYAGDLIEGCLYDSGGFDFLELSETTFAPKEITIRATCASDFAHLSDVFGLIVGQLYNCAGLGTITLSQSIVSSPSGNQGGAQPGPVGAPVVAPASNGKCPAGYYDDSYFWQPVHCVLPSAVNSPDATLAQCDWNKLSLGDYVACQLGIKPQQALIAGAVVALVGVIAISKIAK